MNSLEVDSIWLSYISCFDEEILIRKLLLSHDPDGRHFDSLMLLQTTENIMHYATASEAVVSDLSFSPNLKNHMRNIEVVGSDEPLAHTLWKISVQMLSKCSGAKDLHSSTMMLFDLLGNYRWDAKVVLVLAAFATSYGAFLLAKKLSTCNPLAASVAILRGLPIDITKFKHQFKALNLLAKTMVDVTKCIIKFEGFPLKYVKPDIQTEAAAKSQIYIAAYWVIRSSLTCSSQITDLRTLKPEQVYSNSRVAAWELSSLGYRLSSLCSSLRQEVDACQQQIEAKLYQKLLNLFRQTHIDNQEVLRWLFALNDDLPLKDCSRRLGVSELKHKVTVLLISKPELLSQERLFFLVHQTLDHTQDSNLEGSYEIIWVPISSSSTWTDAEEGSYSFISSTFPWYSVRQPWLLNSAVVNLIKQEWNYKEEPQMVVLDSEGRITNTNALDMVLTWGAKAYPFSISRENDLWEAEFWSLDTIADEIDPLLTKQVQEGRHVCIYGSINQDWTGDFNAKMKEIQRAGVQLELIYVGKSNLDEHTGRILATIIRDMHESMLSFTKMHFFWVRLESMRRSKLRLGRTVDTDHILQEVSALLDFDDNSNGWAVIGKGSSTDIIRLQGKQLMECLNLFQQWGQNVAKLGFMGALKTALEPPLLPEPCNHTNIIPYTEESTEGLVICEKCKRLMKKFIMYQ